ncbi:BZ3500_MvSof-1268-A1-R1_Chr2-2g05077 [Microbotryum saponariae]|uniref:BZ3500_MvSof-1268-A1-R1_Chr2-2g05077 protein n=1 Tax=Microbotryum saponariae TaxID=289078 RepID=A0A2X0KNG1_9BASI|nr:BZ3500_MvSof-1268-A1-R1_Chr2-2g05077 [Microbotryum saponariae]SDA00855.1 BZ3501_MvSof-1269-A2-R1_Chr2-2g04751 [Microbotryum saponariae]
MFISIAAFITAFAASHVSAQASATALDLVDQGWDNSGFGLDTLAGFGLELNATALLTVNYAGGAGVIENGKDYTAAQVSKLPTINFEPAASATTLGAERAYTLILADASSLGDPDKQGNYRHYLSNGATAAANGTDQFAVSGGTVITSYAGPGPLTGSGTHRYAWMLLVQGSGFKAPANLSTAGTSPGHWNVSSYVSEAGGLQLVAASFFTVTASGNPTGSVVTTAPATTPASTRTGSSSPTSTGSGGSTTSAPASATTTSARSGSNQLTATWVFGAVSGLSAMFTLL